MIVGNTVLYGATAGPRVLPRPRRRALRRAQLRRPRRRRGRRRPRLRVHDRRPRGRARADGAQLRRRDERRHRLRLRHRPPLRQPLQHRARRPRRRSSDADADEVKALIAEHAQRTGSLVARNLLASWERGARERFVKVMPRDYKRALEQRSEEPEAVGAAYRCRLGSGSSGTVSLTAAARRRRPGSCRCRIASSGRRRSSPRWPAGGGGPRGDPPGARAGRGRSAPSHP